MSRESFATAHVAAGEHCLPVQPGGSPVTHATNDSEKLWLEGKLNEKMPRWERLAWRAIHAARTLGRGTGGGGGVSPAGKASGSLSGQPAAAGRVATWLCAYECRENGLAVTLEVPASGVGKGFSGPPVIEPPPYLFFAVPGIAGGNFRFNYRGRALVARRIHLPTTTISKEE